MQSIKKQLEPKKFNEAELHKSAGILEDYEIRKVGDIKTIYTDEINSADHSKIPHIELSVASGTHVGYDNAGTGTHTIWTGGTIQNKVNEFDILTISASGLSVQGTSLTNVKIQDYDTHIASTTLHLGQDSSFRAWAGTSQTISTGTITKVTFGSEDYDVNNEFASSRFTAKTAGYYLFEACINFTNLVEGDTGMIYIMKNSSSAPIGLHTHTLGGAIENYLSVCALINMAVNDWVEVYCQQNHGSDRTINNNGATNHFAGKLIR
ncbi:MAG: hypothetical protein M0R35_07150 [Candidatus Omnitrophica bacterium]|nr:hypothetical protein [Candidatus Omnitrophota bacterium]